MVRSSWDLLRSASMMHDPETGGVTGGVRGPARARLSDINEGPRLPRRPVLTIVCSTSSHSKQYGLSHAVNSSEVAEILRYPSRSQKFSYMPI
jgi:hypothetical protein